MLSAAAAAGAAASFIGSAQLRSPSHRALPVRCSVTALEGGAWSTLALAKDALPEADVLDLDLLDGLILTPLLVPILGLVILRSGAAAAGAKLAQLEAQRSLETAEGRIKKLEAKVAERDETLVRKAEFWSDRLAKARGEPRSQAAAAAPRKPTPKPAPVVAAAPKPTPKPKPAPAAPPPAATVGGEAPAPWNVVTRISNGVTQLRPGLTANDLVLVTGAETQAGACMQRAGAPQGLQPPTARRPLPGTHRPAPTAAAPCCAGKLVVAELLQRVPGLRVRACGEGGRAALEASLANIEAEACAVPKSRVEADGSRVEIVAAEEATALTAGVTAVVWCASSAGVRGRPSSSEDGGGVGGAAAVLREASALLRGDQSAMTPKLVLLSTAAASRVGWSRETKKRYPAAADLPIVRLDPQNILGVKAREEAGVRAAGLPYCIVRPCNLDEEYLSEGGYVLSSGDVATGRISHRDVAALLVEALLEPGACGKTLEAFTLPTLPKRPLAAAFRALPADMEAAGSPPPEDAAYGLLQQLAPP